MLLIVFLKEGIFIQTRIFSAGEVVEPDFEFSFIFNLVCNRANDEIIPDIAWGWIVHLRVGD